MADLDTYALMLTDNHNPERLQKIIGHIDVELRRLELDKEKLMKLREIAEKRIKQPKEL